MIRYFILAAITSCIGYSSAINHGLPEEKGKTHVVKKENLSLYIDYKSIKEGHTEAILDILNSNPNDAIWLNYCYVSMYGSNGSYNRIRNPLGVSTYGEIVDYDEMINEAKEEFEEFSDVYNEIIDRLDIRQHLKD